jgi:hypothetical protein
MSVLGELLHERRARPSLGRILNMGAVTLSVGLLLGTVAWGWRVVVRDVSGVPVVRALEGPTRIQPSDPEGETVDHQGLSVNQVQAEGTAGEIAERIRLAPDPGTLRDSDLAPGAIVAGAEIEPVAALSGTDSAVLAVLGEAAPSPEIIERISADIPGVNLSPLPTRRPDHLLRVTNAPEPAPVPALNPEPALAAVVEVDSADLPVGTPLVQLGSFDSIDEARAAWDALHVQFADVMDGKTRVVLKGNVGATEFWRLRAAGFETREDARRFCTVIDSGGEASCIAVAPE